MDESLKYSSWNHETDKKKETIETTFYDIQQGKHSLNNISKAQRTKQNWTYIKLKSKAKSSQNEETTYRTEVDIQNIE